MCFIFDRSVKSDTERSGDQENGIALQQITMKPEGSTHETHTNPNFYMETESESGPPPYPGKENGGIQTVSNGDVHTEDVHPSTQDHRTDNLHSNTDTNGDIQRPDGLLSVEPVSIDKRKRHKSEGAIPSTTQSKTFLDPSNLRKSSMFESKSTISGVKFDDSFIGKISFTI